jgi:hypothetical protein
MLQLETSEGFVRVHVHHRRQGEDAIVYIETGPDRDGTGLQVWMDWEQVDFQAV